MLRSVKAGSTVVVRQSSSHPTDLQKFRGRYQWWKKPVYVAPVTHPLHQGPDFSLVGGRKPDITNYPALARKQEQMELGKRIVTLLKQVNEAERLYEEHTSQQQHIENEVRRWTPSEKGNLEFK
ncbi:unnamed protein product [Bursaphelenchus okinawaensis]|uniref:39S ribosomal protein L52, mitochondrial n=1 Tax=Bursaphelenchus okinawaensis TaxID=465554 RepID=A0A811JTI0_9BILA|nr:unnamed protein product [Bursaphelenchus okinawaensis]CAG9083060.1 unnamed protein product [Bursaphelenchus okinawaensis]